MTLADRDTPDFLEMIRLTLSVAINHFWEPDWLASIGRVWQWRKFDFLDWLRPIETALRRVLLIEAFILALSQSLPVTRRSARPPLAGPTPRKRRPAGLRHDKPEDWPVHLRVLFPLHPSPHRRPSRKLPYPFEKFRGEKPTALRYRRVMHNAWPLALRLNSVIRILDNPGPRIRRLAFALRRARRGAIYRTLQRPQMRRPLLSDTLANSGERCAQLANAFWSSG